MTTILLSMKSLYLNIRALIVMALLLGACGGTDDVDSEYTENERAYSMESASDYNVQGVATFREKRNGDLQLTLQLENTVAGGTHPAHMHYGTTDVPNSRMALMLTPVDGATGTSITTFSHLIDGSSFSFEDLLNFDGSLKVHLDDGANKDVVMCGANIGQNQASTISNMAVCTSGNQ